MVNIFYIDQITLTAHWRSKDMQSLKLPNQCKAADKRLVMQRFVYNFDPFWHQA